MLAAVSHSICSTPCSDRDALAEHWGDPAALSWHPSSGKGGAFFVRAASGPYLVKSLSAREARTLAAVLPALRAHWAAHPDSLMVRVHGAGVYVAGRQRFMVMDNMLPPDDPQQPARVFDIKGSSAHRNAAHLDGGWLEAGLSPPIGADALAALERDAQWLAQHALMDYSMLVAVYDVDGGDDVARFRYRIIDYLQVYDWRKRVARAWKGVWRPWRELSSVEPAFYASRFVEMVQATFAWSL